MTTRLNSSFGLLPSALLCLAWLGASPLALPAATNTVTSLADNGPGTLRAALAAAANGDTINFSVTGTITLTTGTLSAANNVTVLGPGAAALKISNPTGRVFNINGARLSGLTIADGQGANWGSGVLTFIGTVNNVIDNCVVTNNRTPLNGAGIFNSSGATLTISNCIICGNTATNSGNGCGGGICNNGGVLTVINSILSGNSALSGGAVYSTTPNNCTLNNCTVSGNSASSSGGGAYNSTLNNCIVYYNSAPTGSNYDSSTLSYCCTTPSPGGTGNITSAPLFVNTNGWSNLRLQSGSPCINAGNNGYAPGTTDLDGNPRIAGGAVDMGAYEAQGASILTQPADQTVVVGLTATFTVSATGAPPLSYFWRCNGAFIPGATHATYATNNVQFSDTGSQFSCLVSNTVGTILSSNALLTVVPPTVHYVALSSVNPLPPYTNWLTAATNIQDAADASRDGDEIVVTDGLYATGGRAVYGLMNNRVAITRAVTVHSVNGPLVTVIQGQEAPGGGNGDAAIRCVYVGANAVLSGFTLTNGHTRIDGDWALERSGGGAWCEVSGVISNCALSGNSAWDRGGGAYGGTLNNCALSGNWAEEGGGGAEWCTLNNCTLSGNWAERGFGGADFCTLNNCIVYYNYPYNYDWSDLMSYCCTTPLPGGPGNISAEPRFVSTNGWSNLRLQPGSPCINAGNNGYAPGTTDLDGNPRIVGGTVDMGAYEWRPPRALTWIGAPTNSLWDTTTPNWTNPAAGGGLGAYIDGDDVTFDDSSQTNTVTLANAALGPSSVTVSAATTDYTFAGPGSLDGPMNLTKSGNRTLTMNVSNTFSGTVTVNGGILLAGNGAALGTTDGNTIIAAGGTLDVGGQSLGLEEIVVQGNGASGTNAIQNSGGQQQSALCRVVLSGPTTISSGANRWDVHGASGNGYFRGNNHTLTKVGSQDIWLKDVGDTGLGDIQILEGRLGFQGRIGMGNAAATVMVRNASLGFWATANDVPLVKNVVLTNASLYSGGGSNRFEGPITLQGANTLYVSTDLRLDGALSGPGGFIKQAGGTLWLEGVNTYSGPTFIGQNSAVVVGTNSSLGSSYLIEVDGGSTLDVSAPAAFTLGSGQTLIGNGTVRGGNLIFGNGATLAVGFGGSTSTLTVQGKLTLQPGSTCAVDYLKTTGVANDRVTGLAFVTYGGSLVLNNLGATPLAAGDALVLFSAGSYSGAFASITPATPGPGLVWNRCSLASDGTLRVGSIHYVAPACATPVTPYASWATAATNIQNAIDAAVPGDWILVTNGVYQTGARAVYGMSNRVAVTRPVTVQSVNGPAVTWIVGSWVPGTTNGPAAVRCVYLTNAAVLAGFTLTNGATQTSGNDCTNQSGGGVWCESTSALVSNCVLVGNAAQMSGGGAYVGTLNNCALSGNAAAWGGGGASSATLNNCTLSGNSGPYGGGASYGVLNNCIVYYNTGSNGSNYYESTNNYCCTTPLPGGMGNFTNAPLFVNTNGWSNLRLQAGSPCINTGTNACAPGPTDLDGNPRIVGGTVDLGAYEFQLDPFHAWLAQYGLPTDGSADYADTDHDGLNNWQEWCCLTCPTNALSALRMLSATGAVSGVTVTWTSVTNRTYALERATDLGAVPAFSVLQSNVAGLPDATSWTDTNAVGSAPRFYRVRVEN